MIAIQKAVNVIKMGSWTSALDFRYQDETSQFKIECDRIAARKRHEVYTPKPWESLPYLAKDDLGKIHVRGFLHERVAQNRDGSFTHPASLSTQGTIKRLYPVWQAHAHACRKTKVTHHRLVYSLSNEFHDALVKAGRNPDMVLKGMVERSLKAFQEKFHPGDSVGYTYGIHHDTDNLHAHVFIHPRTRAGVLVGMSGKPKKHQGHASRHKDQLGFLRGAVRRRVSGILKELSDPQEAAQLKSHFQSEKVFFVPRRAHTARIGGDFRPRIPAEQELEQKRQAVVLLDQKIAEAKTALLASSDGGQFAFLLGFRQPKWLRLLRNAQAAGLFRQMRELQERRYRMAMDYRAAHRRLLPGLLIARTVSRKTGSRIEHASKATITVRSAGRRSGRKPHF